MSASVPLGTLIGRALRLRCPRCGEGRLFQGWFTMPERCSSCGFRLERPGGYYLGSSYINYGLTAVTLMALYFVLHYQFGWTNRELAPWLAAFCVLFPLWLFRYARALWLAMDCHFDRSVLADEEQR